MQKLTDSQLNDLAKASFHGPDSSIKEYLLEGWKHGYRTSRKIIKGYVHCISTMYGELK